MEASLGEHPRRDKAIPTVISRTCHDGDTTSDRMTRRHRVGNASARSLHEINAGDATGNRQFVGSRHLGIAQKLNHDAARIDIPAQNERVRNALGIVIAAF